MNTNENIHILRDTWGVPHIYAETELGAVFGQGYAMAEDRLPTIFRAYRKALGRMSEVFGEEWIEHDFKQKLHCHEEAARRYFAKMTPFYQAAGQAFVAGIEQYMQEHPERVPAYAMPLQPHFAMALGRYCCWDILLNQFDADLHGSVHATENMRGSNAWAVTGRHTRDGHVITHLDPHVPWSEEWLWHESHLHGGDLHAYGFGHPGHPYFCFGHNEHISWALTMGAPNVVDVVVVKLHPERGDRYFYEGEWRPLHTRTLTVHVQTPDGMRTVTRDVHESHHGPLLDVRGNVGYAFREAYGEDADGIDLWGRITTAKHVGDFLAALQPGTMLPFNLHYGDVQGNIFYIRAAHVPIRPAGYDWAKPVPGDTAQTEWLGFHAVADLPQVLNPACGWYQNCNMSPAAMFPHSPMTEERYDRNLLHGLENDVYMHFADGSNSRGRRAFELLSEVQAQSDRMGFEEALRIATDCYMHGADTWVQGLIAAFEASADDLQEALHLQEALRLLEAWDFLADQESVGSTLFGLWWQALKRERGGIDFTLWNTLLKKEPLSEKDQTSLLRCFSRAVDHLLRHFGRIDVPWKDIYRAKRGDESWPINGGEHLPLRIISQPVAGEGGLLHPTFGQSCPTIVFLQPGHVRSYSALPFGISEDQSSPHYTDQGRHLFAKGRLKDTCFGGRDRLIGRIERETTLVFQKETYLEYLPSPLP